MKHILAFGLAIFLLSGCGANQQKTPEDNIPEPAPVVDYTDTIDYEIPLGFVCDKHGSETQGWYVNCINEETQSSYRIGTLPYQGSIQDIETIVSSILDVFSQDQETTVVQDITIPMGYEAKKITAPIQLTSGEEATMVSIIFEHQSMPYTINQVEINKENIDNEGFMTFVGSIALGDIPAVASEEAPITNETAEVCAQDMYECPNGMAVGRDVANNCEFYPCPEVTITAE